MWRIYRLPGSREIWHIDSGDGTKVFNVRGYEAQVLSRSVDIGGNNVPRAWIELHGELHVIDGIAVFDRMRACKCRENLTSQVAVSAASKATDTDVASESR
jgi:hypothetical protein